MQRWTENRQVLSPTKASLRAGGCDSSGLGGLPITWLVLAFAAATSLQAATNAGFMTGSDLAATSTAKNKKRGDLQVPFIMNQRVRTLYPEIGKALPMTVILAR